MQFVKAHPARIYAIVAAALALVVHYVPDLPSALILGLAAAVLGTGEIVQRTEDGKTIAAGETDEDHDQADGNELSA
ncbi:hypothetical protein [Streptomyces sp. NPDC045369]|uniref:hypothetical protein n=1 Tax=Streptomyces sp. NPDC045369 TaxID=3155732 RepID=UPI0034094D08